jgi:hypothetical protein
VAGPRAERRLDVDFSREPKLQIVDELGDIFHCRREPSPPQIAAHRPKNNLARVKPSKRTFVAYIAGVRD